MSVFVHTLLVLSVLIVYTVVGAIIFHIMEGGANVDIPSMATHSEKNAHDLVIDEEQLALIREIFITSIVSDSSVLLTSTPTPTPEEMPVKLNKNVILSSKDTVHAGLGALKTNMPDYLRKELLKYEDSLYGLISANKPQSTYAEEADTVDNWNLVGSLFYCTTIYTTIGKFGINLWVLLDYIIISFIYVFVNTAYFFVIDGLLYFV